MVKDGRQVVRVPARIAGALIVYNYLGQFIGTGLDYRSSAKLFPYKEMSGLRTVLRHVYPRDGELNRAVGELLLTVAEVRLLAEVCEDMLSKKPKDDGPPLLGAVRWEIEEVLRQVHDCELAVQVITAVDNDE